MIMDTSWAMSEVCITSLKSIQSYCHTVAEVYQRNLYFCKFWQKYRIFSIFAYKSSPIWLFSLFGFVGFVIDMHSIGEI